ncbi:MAG: hypothetical protein R2745_24530 [Vicinamibacterales bacterium]
MRVLTVSIALALTVSAVAAGDQSRSRTPPRDRGEASMTLANVAWVASGATARPTGGRLRIEANRSQRSNGVSSRQSLILVLDNYTGPGDYVASPIGSMFIGVGIDTAALAAAEGNDDAATKAAIATLSKAKRMQLMGAKVTITAVSDTEISGTFSRPSTARVDAPAISNGTFRAVVRP